MNFSKKAATTSTASIIGKPGKLSIYPNPAKDRISIYSGFPFNTVEIFSMNGKMVFQNKNEATQSSVLKLNLNSGMYVLKVGSEKEVASSKLLIEL
jgi:hypothetical protein